MTKPTKWHLDPAKTQISLGIRPIWSESSLSAWRKLGSLAANWVHSEDSDQFWRMPRLIWVCWAHSHFVGFVMWRLIFCIQMHQIMYTNTEGMIMTLTFAQVGTVLSSASFDHFLQFFSESTIQALWCRLRKDDPELSSNFEDFLYKISNEIRKSKVDFDTLESALKRYVFRDLIRNSVRNWDWGHNRSKGTFSMTWL